MCACSRPQQLVPVTHPGAHVWLKGQGSGAGLDAARRGSVPGALPVIKEGGHSLSPAPQKSRPISHMACVSQELSESMKCLQVVGSDSICRMMSSQFAEEKTEF